MARREIGVLASSKMTGRTHRIIAPAEQEKAMRYARRTTDYSILDNIGIIMLKTIITKQFSLCMLKVIPCRKGGSMTKGLVVSISDLQSGGSGCGCRSGGPESLWICSHFYEWDSQFK